nr:origin of replication complex subunit 1B-like [Ipomoea batatas]
MEGCQLLHSERDGIYHQTLLHYDSKRISQANNGADDVFLCEYEYDIHWHSFKCIADIDDGEEDCEEAESEREWNSAEASGSDSEDDVQYEEENNHNLLNRRQLPTHPLAAVIYEALNGHRVGWKKALKLLNERFSNGTEHGKEDNRPCILLIDLIVTVFAYCLSSGLCGTEFVNEI